MDQLANVLSTIRNAQAVGKSSVEVPYSKLSESVCKVLMEKGLLGEVKVFKESGASYKKLHLGLSYDAGMPKISFVRKISKPGHRVYKVSTGLKRVLGGFGVSVVSTSRGVMESSEARKRKLGGEVICEVW